MRRRLVLIALAALLLPSAASAQYYFGQNKVQYRSFDWQVIETEHFLVHYYGSERAAALDAARMAERSYARLTRILQHEWREKKPLILYESNSDFVQTNVTSGDIGEGTGGFTDFFRNRMVLPFTGVYDDFEHVLEHEMVHAFQYDVFSRGRAGAGLQQLASINPPLWFMEGMAEYLSIGPVDPHTAMWMRDAAINGEIPTIEELTYDPRYFPYRFGHALFAYVGQKWGDETVGALLQASLAGGIERAFRRVLGLSLEQLSEEWIAAVQDNYLPQIPDHQRPRTVARVVANRRLSDGGYHISPQISPDGRYVVYLSERNSYFIDLYMAEVDNPRRITRLVSSTLNPDFESLRFIYSAGAWSPDGREYVFSSKSGGEDILNILDVHRRRVVERLELGFSGINNPSFSPDGQRLVFTGFQGGWSDLWVVDRDGGNLRRLTEDAYAEVMPQWSPDGRSIAFATDRGPDTDFSVLRFGMLKIALYWLDGDSIQVLPGMLEGDNTNPVWAPDGRSIMFLSTRSGISNAFLHDLDAGELYQLTRTFTGIAGITDLSPALSWARGADRAAFSYYENGEYNIYVMENPRGLRREPFRSDPGNAIVLANASALPLRAEQGFAALGRPAAGEAPLVTAARPPAAPAPAALPGPPQQAPQAGNEPGRAAPGGQPAAEPATPFGAGSIYRSGGRLRPSDAQPSTPPGGGAAPISVAALLDSVQLALPDTSEFTIRSYRPSYAADLMSRPTIGYARDSFGRGFFGGAAVQFTDLLGDHVIQLAGAINGRIQEAQLFAAYTNLAHRWNWSTGVAQDVYYYYAQGEYQVGQPGQPDILNQRLRRWTSRQAFFLTQYPFSRFNRLELRGFLINLEQATLNQLLYIDPLTYQPYAGEETITVENSRLFALPSVALVHDNSLFGWTSPFIGSRWRLELGQAVGGFSYTRGLVDWRRYTSLGVPFSFATRLTSVGHFGQDENLFPSFIGTPDNVRGYTYGSLLENECRSLLVGQSQGCPQLDQLIGSRMAVASAEFRFPLLRSLALGFAPIGLPPVEAAVFYDVGLSWQSGSTVTWKRSDDDPSTVRSPVASYGAGLRFNLFNFVILSVDYARPLNRPQFKKGYWIVSLYPPW